jgi:hypothetical protein
MPAPDQHRAHAGEREPRVAAWPGARGVIPAAAACAFLVTLAAWSLAPHAPFFEVAAPLLSFGAAVLAAFVSLYVGSAAAPRRGDALVIAGLSAAVLTVVYVTHAESILAAGAVNAALVALALAVGASIGARVEHPGHLLPAGAVAACADILSVFHPAGPTHAIVADERALSIAAFAFPVPGVRALAPAIGGGDLLFASLVLGAVLVHGLPRARAALLLWAGAMAAGLLSAISRHAIPALPLMAFAVLAGVPAARQVRGKDRRATGFAIALAIAAVVGLLLRGA